MDAIVSYPLVPVSPEQRALVPVATSLAVVEPESQSEAEPQWWLWLSWLCGVLFLALAIIRLLRLQLIELRHQAHYWRAQHARALERLAEAAAEIQRLRAEIRDWQQRVYGRKSETSSARSEAQGLPSSRPKRSRGQQRGSKGHGRRCHDHLPTTDENCTLPQDEQGCPTCGEPFEEIPGTADGHILEIDVRAHRRRYHRQRYRRRCTCPHQPRLITAPPPDKLIAKSSIGISLWVLILQRKFAFFQPLYRVLAELRGHGLCLPSGTIIDGLKKLVPLFQPLYEILLDHNRRDKHWHCDETRWLVFIKHAGKAGFCWNLWVFAGRESIAFVLDPTRSHHVPEDHFGEDAEGIASVDRYSSYKAMAQVKEGNITLAFCWAHVRRDFLGVFTSWDELHDWAWSWIEEIGWLYQRNDQRCQVLQDASAFAAADQAVRAQIDHMRQRRDDELAQPNLRQPQRKVLTSLCNHWSGLTVFVDHPEVPMDNNEAERRERGPVVARKNFYGSGSLWSGRLAAMLFSLFQTIQLWNMHVGNWLTAFLEACAAAGGRPPPEPHSFLPWNMTPEERKRLSPGEAPQPDPAPARASASLNSSP
jgi:transposase